MPLNRRELLTASAGAVSALALAPLELRAAPPATRSALGIVEHSFGIRFATDRSRGGPDRVDDPLGFLEYCARLGSGGVQIAMGVRDPAYTTKLRERAEALSMYVEGSVRLPRDEADRERFAAELRTAKDAGATVVRTAVLSGRRYETFTSAEGFREFTDRAFQSLVLAEPIVAKQDLKLAVENHKDWRVDELTSMLKRLDSRHIGVCLDTGNSIALLEDPMAVVDALAPWAFSTHLKDMGVQEYPQGFLLSEVPFGDGFLDIPAIVAKVRKAHPETRFILEMITRDPLKVPCVSEKYWATFEKVSGRDLARTLGMVRSHVPKQPLPTVSPLRQGEKLRTEEENVRHCLSYSISQLKV